MDLALYAPSDDLNATNFNFTVPAGIVISGIQMELDAFFTGTVNYGIIDVQLLKGGNPVGSIVQILPTNSNVTYTIGGPGVLFGTTWLSTDFNSTQFGVQVTAQQLTGGTNAVFSVRNVRLRVLGSTSTTVWVYNDFTTDANLDELLIAPQNHLNDPPPGAPGSSVNQIVGTLTTYWNGRMWMAVGNFVYFNAGPDCVNGVPEEAWPPANRFQFAGPVLNLVPSPDGAGLLVWLADRVNAILGGPETISFYPTDAFSNFGISNPNAIFKDGSLIGLFSTQKQYWQLAGNKDEVGEHVADYLTANFPPASTYVTMHRDGLDVGMFLSNGTDQVLRYGTNISAWSVPAFPLSGAGALRSIETSVGVNTLMLAPPTAGTTAVIPLTNPSLGASTGTGTAWANPTNIQNGVSTDYATVTMNAALLTPSENNATNAFAYTLGAATVVTTITPSITPINVGDTAFMVYYPQNEAANSDATIVSGVTDNLGNVWQLLFPTQQPLTHSYFQVFYATMKTAVPVSSSLIITGAIAFHAEATINYASFANFTNLGVLDQTQQQISTASSDPVSGAGLTTASRELLMSFVWVDGGTIPLTPPTGWTQDNSNFGHPNTSPVADSIAWDVATAGSYTDQWTSGANATAWAANFATFVIAETTLTSQALAASTYPLNLPNGAVVQGVEVSVTGKTTDTAAALTITPLNAAVGAESDDFTLTGSNTTQIFGSATDTWNMPTWQSSGGLNLNTFGFGITASVTAASGTISISQVQVKVFYQYPPSYLFARDTSTYSDNGAYGANNGAPYNECFITIGSITLSAPGAPMFPLQHVVGYFDSVGTKPNVWILPNEISDTKGVGFIQLPEHTPEPPVGQTNPSESLWALRWPVNMLNSSLASQYVHHLQVKIMFNEENAANTIKAISFKEDQD
jgi:hypothetical protein